MPVISLDEWRKKQEDISASNSQSKQNTKLEEHGLIPTNADELEQLREIWQILQTAKQKPFTTKSDIAREAATAIAFLASEGMLSTQLNEDTWTNRWMLTAVGLEWMEELSDVPRS
jgi:hypothetical protein